MFKFKKLIFLVSLSLIGMFLLGACGSEVPTAPPPEPATTEESTTENQVPASRSEVPRISAGELKERLDNGEAIIIADTRSLSSYETNHIAGAISVPASEVEEHLAELPLDQEIVFYCS